MGRTTADALVAAPGIPADPSGAQARLPGARADAAACLVELQEQLKAGGGVADVAAGALHVQAAAGLAAATVSALLAHLEVLQLAQALAEERAAGLAEAAAAATRQLDQQLAPGGVPAGDGVAAGGDGGGGGLGSPASAAAGAPLVEAIGQLRAAATAAAARLAQLEGQRDALTQQLLVAQGQVRRLQGSQGEYEAAVAQLEARVAELQQAAAAAQARHAQVGGRSSSAPSWRRVLGVRLRVAYRAPGTNTTCRHMGLHLRAAA